MALFKLFFLKRRDCSIGFYLMRGLNYRFIPYFVQIFYNYSCNPKKNPYDCQVSLQGHVEWALG